ncbi:MAG: trigger factor [Micrococcales bacterium]|nr:MAG: trigger factor [Micrococcales bacterium]PIE26608.1 MAG: trigger factor [Micrococcales bacterium]
MKSAVETLNPTRVKLTVEVPFAELKPQMDAAYAAIAKQISVPGFRKGKVPARIIDQRVGRATVVAEAMNDAIPQYYRNAAIENRIRPLGQPEIEVTDVPTEGESELKFAAEVDVAPELELPDFTTLAVTVDALEVSEEDVDARLADMRTRFGTLSGVDRPVADGDFLNMDLLAQIDGAEIDTAKGISYEVGSGNMLDGLDEAVTGAAAGDTVTFTAPLVGGEHAGEDAELTVTVNSVKERVLPDLDDEFAELTSEFDTLDELREDVRRQVEEQKKFEQGLQARDRVLEALLAATEVPVPEALVEAEVKMHLEQDDREDDEQHRAEVADSAREAIRSQLLLDAIVDKHEVQVGQSELTEYLIGQAASYGMDPNTFAQQLAQSDHIPAVIGEVARRKALAVALESATITDTEGATIDLDDLVPQNEDVEDLDEEDVEAEESDDEELVVDAEIVDGQQQADAHGEPASTQPASTEPEATPGA